MITLSNNYISKIRKDNLFADEIKNELFVLILLNKFVDSSVFILGKEGQYPDIYLADGNYGYEITQADLDEDLNHKRLFRMMQESNYLFESLKSKALFENFELGQYSFITNSNGYIVSFSSSDKYFGKERFYFLPVLQKILKRN